MVRTSFTLSPRGGSVGGIHPGLSRLAVFSWLFARHSGGEFRLRIEDTDTETKSGPENDKTTDSLKWLGLDWDGELVRQSARMDHYEKTASRLVREGRAYPCYCTLQEIEERNKKNEGHTQQHHYDGKCRDLTGNQIREFEAEGREPSIRFMAYNEEFSYNDLRKGNVPIPAGTVGDFIILRSNKTPIGFFAEAADHFEMGITHIFRNEEHPSATVRQLMLYRSLAMEPVLYYLPALTDTEGRKVQNTTPETDLRTKGYLPEAVLNHLALSGWSSPDGRQLLGREELVRLFTPEGLLSQPAVFDRSLLDWISRHYIINAELKTVFEQTLPYFQKGPAPVREMLANPEKRDFIRNAVDLVRGYCNNLSEVMEHTVYFLSDDYPFSAEAGNLLGKKEAGKVLSAFGEWIGKNERNMDENLFGELIADLSRKTELKGKALYQTLKAALTGRTDGPDIYYLVPVIGRENTLKRIEHAARVHRPA